MKSACTFCLPSSGLLLLQAVEVVEAHEKDGKLLGLLAKHHKSRTNRILVFVLYKKEAARVETLLQRKGWKVGCQKSSVHS